MSAKSYLSSIPCFCSKLSLILIESSCGHGTKAVIQTHKSINE